MQEATTSSAVWNPRLPERLMDGMTQLSSICSAPLELTFSQGEEFGEQVGVRTKAISEMKNL